MSDILQTPNINIPQPGAQERPFDRQLWPTPFHMRSAQANRKNSWGRWGDFTCPLVYQDIENDYFALRARAAILDFSPLFKYRINGPQAEAYLARLLSLSGLPSPGRAARVMICDDDGILLADGVLHHMWKGEYRLTLEVSLMSWLADSLSGFDAVLTEITMSFALLAIAGPSARAVLLAAGLSDVETMRLFDIRACAPGGVPLSVVHTASLGEPGYELWVEAPQALILWDRIMRVGAAFGLGHAGLLAMDICRLETANPRVSRDYTSHEIEVTKGKPLLRPRAMGYGRYVSALPDTQIKNADALRLMGASCMEAGAYELIGLEIEGQQSGAITSQIYSPRLGIMIALVLLPASQCESSNITFVTAQKNGDGSSRKKIAAKLHAGRFVSMAQQTVPPPSDF